MINKQRGFSLALILILIAGIAGGSFYLYTNSDDYIARHGKTEIVDGPLGDKVVVENAGRHTQLPRTIKGIIKVEGDWSTYAVSDWEGFQFSYPSAWTLNEKMFNPEISPSILSTVEVTGDSETISFTNVGKGLPTGPETISTTEVIAGHEVKFHREKGDPGFIAVVSCSGRLGGLFVSQTGSRAVTDRVVASLKCPSFEGQE